MTRPFRFGVQSYFAESADDWREQVRRAEGNGYDVFTVADHYFGPGPAMSAANHGLQNLACIPAMATALEATETIRVGSRVICCDYHQPVVLAKSLATLDFLSDGRLEIGLGAGWVASEYEAMGLDMDRAGVRIDRMIEYVDLLKKSFAEGQLDVRGDHVTVTGMEAVPKPVQSDPPIMIGGGSPRVLRIAGQLADIVSLNFDNSEGKIGAVGVGSGYAARTKEKVSWVAEGAGDRFDDVEIEIGGYFTIVTDDAEAASAALAARFGMPPDGLDGHMHTLIGSVDQICDELERRRDGYGITYTTVPVGVADAFAPVVERLAGR